MALDEETTDKQEKKERNGTGKKEKPLHLLLLVDPSKRDNWKQQLTEIVFIPSHDNLMWPQDIRSNGHLAIGQTQTTADRMAVDVDKEYLVVRHNLS